MKKRLIIVNTSLIIISLVIFLIVSIFVVSNQNVKTTNKEIKSYASIAESLYNDSSNYDNIAKALKKANKNLRVTIIKQDGTILFDSDSETEENHLERPEIKNLGTVAYRYSTTLKKKMIYTAIYNDINQVYIRVSMPESVVMQPINSLILYGILVILFISIISSIIIVKSIEKNLEPLKKETKKLSMILDEDSYEGYDIELLSLQIDKVYQLINSKIEQLDFEKRKLSYIIENMNQGLVIINPDYNIDLINNYALDLFERKREDIEFKPYNYLFINKNIDELVVNAVNNKSLENYYLEINDRFYLLTINSLSDFIKSSNKFSVSIFILDITDEKRSQKMKLDFFSNASHELKSPLTSIIGYQEMIQEGIITDKDEVNDAVFKTIKEARRMNQIIIEMLELSHLESNMEVKKNKISIEKVINDVKSNFELQAKNKNINVNIEGKDFDLMINDEQIYELIKNLYDNAIKYNKENGNIDIYYSDNKFIIKDSGIGISKQDQSRIFERFYRVDKARSKKEGGTGLGLSIVKYICINNQIDITLDSKLDVGTTFTLNFKNNN